MSLLVLGVTHHAAPLPVLEAVALDPAARARLERQALASEHIREVVALSTCNRTEVYVEGSTFHGALRDVTDALTDASGLTRDELQPHLFVHYEDRAVAHAFAVASGLDSMAVGEVQILGQVRRALRSAQERGHVGPSLNTLLQHALRVGKLAHSETGIDAVAGSLVGAGLDLAARVIGPLTSARVVVLGAGGMAALAATTAQRHGVADLVVVNRSLERAAALADRVAGHALPMTHLPEGLAGADLIVSATGAVGRVITRADVERARAGVESARPLVFVDLALPHDIDTDVTVVPGVSRIGLTELGEHLAGAGDHPEVVAARDLVTAEVAAFLGMRAADIVVPTVSALRAHAGALVADEVARLDRRLPSLSDAERAEVVRAIERVVDKLLHTPTVRVKEFAGSGLGGSYARALSELFDLDPRDTAVVSVPPVIPGEER